MIHLIIDACIAKIIIIFQIINGGNNHGGRYNKTFQTPEECIDYNNELLSKSFPELAKYYYNHPDNPRNWPWTFRNSVLGSIGFNDDDNICDEDFNENMEE